MPTNCYEIEVYVRQIMPMLGNLRNPGCTLRCRLLLNLSINYTHAKQTRSFLSANGCMSDIPTVINAFTYRPTIRTGTASINVTAVSPMLASAFVCTSLAVCSVRTLLFASVESSFGRIDYCTSTSKQKKSLK